MLPWLQSMVQPCLTCEPCRADGRDRRRDEEELTKLRRRKRKPFVPRLPENARHQVELVFSPLAGMQGLLGYHSSVLIDGEEYYFTPSGIRCYPKLSSHKRTSDVERIHVGESQLGGTILLDVLSKHFQPRTYDLLRKNCNNFTARWLGQKVHLDTLQQDEAERFDAAWQGWQRALRKAQAQPDEPPPELPMGKKGQIPAVCLPCELPVPPGLFEVPWYYDERWHQRSSSAKLISSAAFLAASCLWHCMPRLRRYREIHPSERPKFAAALGRIVGRLLPQHGVLCVEKPYLDGFVEGLAETVKADFILLAVNGGDAPLTLPQQQHIAALPGLQACFAMNLHCSCDARFAPLPIGLPQHADGLHRGNLRAAGEAEAAIARCISGAAPWHLRDGRLLVTPMQASRLRSRYVERLTQPEFAALVRVVKTRLSFEAFLQLLAEHRAVLSPPGRGHDCYRTWQALAVGTAPLVVEDPLFDQRLYSSAGLQTIPAPEQLTPESLSLLLQQLSPPAAQRVQMEPLRVIGALVVGLG
ncbi:unnamed protein product [Effrenium voratum]|nr:unnamed protein product [Effrenium voratum]